MIFFQNFQDIIPLPLSSSPLFLMRNKLSLLHCSCACNISFFFILSFQQFEYDVPRYNFFVSIYSSWGLLEFLHMWVALLITFRKILINIQILFSVRFHSCFLFDSIYTYFRLLDTIPWDVSNILFIFLCFGCMVCEILVPWPVVEPSLPVLEAWSLNHWTTKEVLKWFKSLFSPCFILDDLDYFIFKFTYPFFFI